MSRYTKEQRTEAIEALRDLLNPGDTLYTVLGSVARSGMSRQVSVYVVKNNEPRFLTGYAAIALGMTREGDYIRVGGCGMDAGFEVVYNLGRVLYPEGYTCTGENCHSNDHSNGDRDYSPHHHNDGGYAFAHRWL